MTTLWTCPKPDCAPTKYAPLGEADLAPFLTTSEVAESFGVSMNNVYKWIQTGKAPSHYRIGSSITSDRVMCWSVMGSRALSVPASVVGSTGETHSRKSMLLRRTKISCSDPPLAPVRTAYPS
jgi:excisionase family DNA binding protein